MSKALTSEFIFNHEKYEINIVTDDFIHLPSHIIVSLYNLKQYEVQSNISKEVFQSLCQYFSNHQLPNIDESNIYQWFQLDKEFCIPSINKSIESKKESLGKHSLNIIFLQSNINADNSDIEKEIAMDLDIYVKNYGKELLNLPIQTLYNIFYHKDRKFTKHTLLYELIKNFYQRTNDENIFSLLQSIDINEI